MLPQLIPHILGYGEAPRVRPEEIGHAQQVEDDTEGLPEDAGEEVEVSDGDRPANGVEGLTVVVPCASEVTLPKKIALVTAEIFRVSQEDFVQR